MILAGLGLLLTWGYRVTDHGPERKVATVASPAGDEDPLLPRTPELLEDDADFCGPITQNERARFRRETGLDMVSFVEDSAREMHGARAAEDQLKIISSRFDHQRWSNAWLPGATVASGSAGTSLGQSNAQVIEALRLQTGLSHASIFLSRYHRLIENGVRQEESALRAFQWHDEDLREIRKQPMRALVRSYLPRTCEGADQAQYGCERGEKIYRVRAILSPRIACRFPEKRDQYTAFFWVRVSDVNGRPEARIFEVEANGQRLVKMTYDELVHKQLLSVLMPNVSETLISAGLDPFRTPVLWRKWLQERFEARAPTSVQTRSK